MIRNKLKQTRNSNTCKTVEYRVCIFLVIKHWY